MAIVFNKTTVPTNGSIVYNGTSLKTVVYNGVTVWRKTTTQSVSKRTSIFYWQNASNVKREENVSYGITYLSTPNVTSKTYANDGGYPVWEYGTLHGWGVTPYADHAYCWMTGSSGSHNTNGHVEFTVSGSVYA